ncbi:MAG: hypothetical protein JWM95_1212 [Gemmatimonadetes bacterium]|nr:hypothetical protein [Gemmatimonadota bacterium]
MTDDPIPALKNQLVGEILSAVADMNTTVAAGALEIGAARFADLRHGRVARFSVERLIRMLASIDHRVVLQVEAPAVRVSWFRLIRDRKHRQDQ